MERYAEQNVSVDISHSLIRSLTLLLTSRYVWIDWSSMPQPSACPPSVHKREEKSDESRQSYEIDSRVRSKFSPYSSAHTTDIVDRYVEKSDFVVIVAPGCLHTNRRDPTPIVPNMLQNV